MNIREKQRIGALVIFWLKKPPKITRKKILAILKKHQSKNLKFIDAVKTSIIIFTSTNLPKNKIEKRVEKILSLELKTQVKIKAISFTTLNEVTSRIKEILAEREEHRQHVNTNLIRNKIL